MPFRKQRPALAFSQVELARLKSLERSRTEEKRKVVRASILIDSLAGLSERAIAAKHRVNRNTVIRCVSKCLRFGWEAALSDLQRPGKPRRLTDDAIAWVRNLACQKPPQLGYAEELWTYRLLTQHIQPHAEAAGYPSLRTLSRSKLHHLLTQAEIQPHKIRYYVEKRAPDFDRKMAEVLHVYKEVEIINDNLISGAVKEPSTVTVSYDEKTGIQALANTSADRPPIPGQHPAFRRDYEYKRLGTLSLLAGIDLHRGTITESISETHNSQDFVAFLKKLEQAYPETQAIRLILDNHSAHISKETQSYLATRPQRFQFVFKPKHGSWLNLVEVFFSKLTRTVLRGIRVASKEELVNRLRQHIETLNQHPVVFRWRWRYKMAEEASMA
jgi:transposase